MPNKNNRSGETERSTTPAPTTLQPPPAMSSGIGTARFCIGVDGGGSGTRVLIAPYVDPVAARAPMSAIAAPDIDWPLRGAAGPSGLGLGIERAWEAISRACSDAFAAAQIEWHWSDCVMACGLAGVNHLPWRDAFIAGAPPLRSLSVFSDAFTTWAGALGDGTMPGAASASAPASKALSGREGRGRTQPAGRVDDEVIAGVVIALGTGSIGCAMDAARGWRTVGGFGFPSGDEASGAWIGLQAAGHAQRALDGRVPMDAFARALIDAMTRPERDGTVLAPGVGDAADVAFGADARGVAERSVDGAQSHGRDRLLAWLTSANQTDYATLMRVVVDFPEHATVRALRARAAADVDMMIDALDPAMALPVVLAGSVSAWLADAIAPRHRARLRAAAGDATSGALRVAQGWAKPGATSARG